MTLPAVGHHADRASLLRQVASFAPGSLIPAAVSLAIAVVFTRIFDAAAFGQYSLMLSVGMLVTMVSTQWLQQGLGRYVPGVSDADQANELRASASASITALCVGTAILGGAVVAALRPLLDPTWHPLLLPTLAFIAGTSIVEPLLVMLQSSFRGARFSLYRAADSLLRFGLGLAAVLLVARTPQALLWGTACAPLLLAPVLWRDVRLPGPLGSVLRLRALGAHVRRLSRYGMPMVGWFAASYVLNVSDRYVIQLFRGSAEVGIYAANYSLAAGVSSLLAAPVLLAAHPRLMQAWDAGRTDAAEQWLGRIVELFIITGALMFGLLLLFSADVAGVLLGTEFREGHLVMAIALAGTITWQLGVFAQKPLEFTERVGLVLVAAAGAALFNIIANVVFVPAYGYIAAAWTTVASYMLYAAVTTWLGRRILRWRIRWVHVAALLALILAGLTLADGVRRLDGIDSTSALLLRGAIALFTALAVGYRAARVALHPTAARDA